jgi:hypothetical protein
MWKYPVLWRKRRKPSLSLTTESIGVWLVLIAPLLDFSKSGFAHSFAPRLFTRDVGKQKFPRLHAKINNFRIRRQSCLMVRGKSQIYGSRWIADESQILAFSDGQGPPSVAVPDTSIPISDSKVDVDRGVMRPDRE